MSLNWREIDAVLAELDLPGSFLQDVVQTDFRNLYLEIFRPGRRFHLRISLETGKTRLHASERRPKKPKKRQRFAQVLHSRIKGAHITAAEQVNDDRIVRIGLARGDETTLLWIRLWGGASNCILTDGEGAIIDAFFRRPKRGEISGGRYFVGKEPASADRAAKKESFVSRWSTDINAEIDRHYADAEHDEELGRLRSQAEQVLERRRVSAQRRATAATRLLEGDEDADRFQELGDLITANLYRIDRGAESVEVEDYNHSGDLVLIELDPRKSPQENAQAYYEKAQRTRRKIENASEEISVANLAVEQTQALLEGIVTMDIRELRELVEDEKSQRMPAAGESDTPGLTARSGDFTILIGRNSRENDELLRRHVRGNDLWLHTRDYPGGYVFVRSRPGKSVPLDVLLDAGNLAIHYSKAKSNGRADLFYTHVKYLRRAKDGPRGLVIPTQEKNLHVVVEENRIDRLLGRDHS